MRPRARMDEQRGRLSWLAARRVFTRQMHSVRHVTIKDELPHVWACNGIGTFTFFIIGRVPMLSGP